MSALLYMRRLGHKMSPIVKTAYMKTPKLKTPKMPSIKATPGNYLQSLPMPKIKATAKKQKPMLKVSNVGMKIPKTGLKGIIQKAEGGNIIGASKDLLTNKPARNQAFQIATSMKRSGRFNNPNVRGMNEIIPDKMPSMLGLPGQAKRTVSYLNSNRTNQAFRDELKSILAEAKKRAG